MTESVYVLQLFDFTFLPQRCISVMIMTILRHTLCPVFQSRITRCCLCYSVPVCYVLFHICSISRTPD